MDHGCRAWMMPEKHGMGRMRWRRYKSMDHAQKFWIMFRERRSCLESEDRARRERIIPGEHRSCVRTRIWRQDACQQTTRRKLPDHYESTKQDRRAFDHYHTEL